MRVPVVPRPATKWVIAGQVGEQLGAGALLVREGVGLVAVLVEHHPVGVLARDLLGDAHGLVGAAGGGRGDDLGAPHAQQLAPLLGGVLGHHADDAVALELGRHRQRDAGVAAGRLEDRAAGTQGAVLLGLLDHPQRRPVLDGAGRVAVLELGPEAYVGAGRQPRQPDQRRAADRVQQAVVAGHALSAPAGDGGEHDDLVAVAERGLEAADEADVLVVDVDVDEAAQVAVLDEATLDAGVVALEVVDQRGERRPAAVDGLGAVGVGAQDGGDTDLDGHQGVLSSVSRGQLGVIVTSSSVTTPSMML